MLKLQIFGIVCALMLVVGSAFAQQPGNAAIRQLSKSQLTLAQAAEQGKFTFVVFYRQSDPATQQMVSALNEGLAQKPGEAFVSYAQLGDPASQPLVEKYGLARAPMPLTLAVAPNGAVTGVFPQRVNAGQIDGAFVSPTMMFTMKAVQEGKIVLVDVQGTAPTPSPAAIAGFRADPHFASRLAVASMRASDPREVTFANRMQIDRTAPQPQLLLIAPPGVLVGKFDANATKDHLAAALAKAGKCCNDPQCKHNQ